MVVLHIINILFTHFKNKKKLLLHQEKSPFPHKAAMVKGKGDYLMCAFTISRSW